MAIVSNARIPGPVLIAGFGSAGRRHFRNLRSLGCRDFVFLRSGFGVLDDRDIAEFPSTGSLEEALSYRPKVAVIATPTARHLEIALPAAEAGCDLYIEKPLGRELKDIERLLTVVRKKRLVGMVGCQFRFHPLLMELRSMVREGRLGRIVGAAAEYGDYLPSWHPWEDYRRSCSARDDLGGGAILTLIHPLDYLYMLFGEWRRIQAMSSAAPLLDTSAAEDWCNINIEFASGVLAQVHVDYLQRPAVHRLSVVGESGRAVCDYNSGELTWQPAQGEAISRRVPAAFERNTMFLGAMEHFINCVANRTEPQASLADGAAVLSIALEARRGASTGRSLPQRAPALFDLAGRVAVLTGGAGLLGRQYIRTLLAAGARVMIADLDGDGAEREAAAAVADAGGEAIGLRIDVSRQEDVTALIDATLSAWGRLDILINNAAIDPKADTQAGDALSNTFEDFPLAEWRRSLDVNLTGAFLCAQAAGRVMVRAGRGVIVNVSSTYGLVAPDQRLYQRDDEEEQRQFKPASYAVTKAAVAHLTRYLAAYWGPSGIRVNTLTPHGIFNGHDEQFVRRYNIRTPLGRMARTDEMNGPLLFLISDASSYMTGANLVVDGGWTAW
jgi:NAD(P)-dependent dehydrogenase (short-subunit alcohol dehydrogenase family)/predicted dehydrogenase